MVVGIYVYTIISTEGEHGAGARTRYARRFQFFNSLSPLLWKWKCELQIMIGAVFKLLGDFGVLQDHHTFMEKGNDIKPTKPNLQGDAILESAEKFEDVVMSEHSSLNGKLPIKDGEVDLGSQPESPRGAQKEPKEVAASPEEVTLTVLTYERSRTFKSTTRTDKPSSDDISTDENINQGMIT
uniref:Uncharacterized protein n=1 Tax=Glossina austeni TaxID=7395 RepID=A0A1A9VP75_GLOAU